MRFNAEIVDVTKEQGISAKGNAYTYLNVAYKKDGKIDGKKVMPFGSKEVFAALEKAQKGDQLLVTTEKNDGGFWEWTSVTSGQDGPQTNTATTGTQSSGISSKPQNVTPKSTYETPEERAARQVMIVRQSSISSAVALLKTEKHVPEVKDILATAKAFEDYVFGKTHVKIDQPQTTEFIGDMADDLPWNEAP